MVPSADEILAAWPFLARRFGIDATPSRVAIEAAVRLAIECAADRVDDEPAALFYAFARYPRAVPGAWRLLGERLARAHGARLGLVLVPTAAELAALRLEIVQGRADCAAVKAWFAARLRSR